MAQTVFAAITSAIVLLIEAAPSVSANIFRARDRQLAEQYPNAVAIQVEDADPDEGAILGAPVDWRSIFTIDCWARTTTTSADLAVDPLLAGVYARMAADTTLGGLVDNIGVPRIAFEFTAEKQKTGWVRLTYLITHRTSNSTLEMP
jgi:hypothetical protein